MSLQVWLPLTKDLRNQGLSGATVTNNGAVYSSTNGKLGGCYNFTNQNIVVPSTSFKGEFTNNQASLTAWVKVTTSHGAYAQALVLGTQGTSWNNILFGIDINGSGTPIANASTGSAYTNLSFGTAIKDGVWHHIAYTYNAGTMKVYLDGVQKATTTTSNTPTWTSSTNLYIGGNTAGEKFQNGDGMNDVRLYNHCLSLMEVKELAKGLILHYPLNRQGWGQENLLRGSNVIGTGTSVYGWVSNGSATGMEILSDGSLHYKYNISNSKYIPSITTNTVVPCEFSKTYFYSMDLKFDKAITLGTSVPAHYWAGARNSDSITNTSCNGNLTGIQTQFISNHSGTLPANTWVNITTKFTFPAAATTSGYNYPAIRCFVYGSVLTETITGEVNVWMKNCKVEEGSIETPWCPHKEDALATTMDLNSTIEYDCSGFCNNGTRTGTFTWTSDTPKYNVSQYFQDYTRYISCPVNGWTPTALTLSCWVKSSNKSPRGNWHIPLNIDGQKAEISIYNNGQITTGFVIGGTRRTGNFGSVDILNGQWHMLTVTFDGNTIKSYIDAVLIESRNYSGTLSSMNTVYLGIFGGNNTYANTQLYQSDSRIYATALSADDVKSLYQNSAYIDSSGNVYGAVHTEV